jgi:Fe-S-cluster containining protein
MAKWQCIKNCGACCYLNPEERPGLEYFLTPEEMKFYLSLVGTDGWCIHYDRERRECKIYPDRPYFCRVEPEVFLKLYDVPPAELSDFAIECCREHIADIYGINSPEFDRFEQAIN